MGLCGVVVWCCEVALCGVLLWGYVVVLWCCVDGNGEVWCDGDDGDVEAEEGGEVTEEVNLCVCVCVCVLP